MRPLGYNMGTLSTLGGYLSVALQSGCTRSQSHPIGYESSYATNSSTFGVDGHFNICLYNGNEINLLYF